MSPITNNSAFKRFLADNAVYESNAGGRSLIIVGGGFFGCALAVFAKTSLKFEHVLVLERERSILLRASYNNQARVHNGYHYPRSFPTAYRSRLLLPRFSVEFSDAIDRSFIKLYAIARDGSKVSARQFERFCQEIGAPLERARREHAVLFDAGRVEAVYQTEEFAFDAARLSRMFEQRMAEAGVDVVYGATALVRPGESTQRANATVDIDGEGRYNLQADWILNCTYGGLMETVEGGLKAPLRFELTELAIVEAPAPFDSLGITVMDGAYFSIMPFPARPGLHSFSHVRYTPHLAWNSDDVAHADPYERLKAWPKQTCFDRMRRDTARLVPGLAQVRHVDSHWEVKAVLAKRDSDDARPILFEEHRHNSRVISILGGKLDNIYDAYIAFADAVGA